MAELQHQRSRILEHWLYQINKVPDDSRLSVLSSYGSVYVWDLSRLREELRQVGLDWDTPAPKVSRERESVSRHPLEVTVVESETK